GVDKNFDKGLTNYESEPLGFLVTGDGDVTVLIATPDEETGDDPMDNFIHIDFSSRTTGTFSPILISMNIEGVNYYNGTGSITVTKYEDMGGVIEGTFYGTAMNGASLEITEGKFKVKRIADNTYID
ncbi:MAG: hypothetical protein JSV25_14935, partial [Spirochaetota bacterium]